MKKRKNFEDIIKINPDAARGLLPPNPFKVTQKCKGEYVTNVVSGTKQEDLESMVTMIYLSTTPEVQNWLCQVYPNFDFSELAVKYPLPFMGDLMVTLNKGIFMDALEDIWVYD